MKHKNVPIHEADWGLGQGWREGDTSCGIGVELLYPSNYIVHTFEMIEPSKKIYLKEKMTLRARKIF